MTIVTALQNHAIQQLDVNLFPLYAMMTMRVLRKHVITQVDANTWRYLVMTTKLVLQVS
jgi:hypothetical protein